MFDILVNGQLVAICSEAVVKLFCNTLINNLSPEISLVSRRHVEPAPQAPEAPKKETNK